MILMGFMMDIKKVILLILFVGSIMAFYSCEKKENIPLYEIPQLPKRELIFVEENPPGNEDRVFGLSGAVCNDCKVIVFADEGLTNEIHSEIANEDGSFLPISIGDNMFGEVFLLVENKIGFRSPYIVLQNDIFPPETEITEFPSNPTEMTSITFKFSCSEDGCAFECKIDNEEWERCSSPITYFLKGGNHRFDVRAIDKAGNKDYSPAFYEWRIEPPFPGSLLWTFSQIEKIPERVGEGYAPSPAFGDIDGDGKLEVVVAPYNVVHAINGEDGSLLWSYPIPFSYPILSPLLADIDGDGRLEVIIGGDKIYTLNGEDGSLLWSYDSEDWQVYPLLTGDLDKDGKEEVVVADAYKIYALNGEDGSLLWSYNTGNWQWPSSIADLDGDGRLEIVTGSPWTKNKILAINGEDGSLLWSSSMELEGSFPVIGDIDGDGRLEVITNSSGDIANIYALNGEDGSILWVNENTCRIEPPSLADIDNDGKLEVVVGNYCKKEFYAINGEDGSLLWISSKLDSPNGPVLIGDIDEDSKLEVVGTLLNSIYALNGEDGSPLWIYDNTSGVNTPSLTDINGDGIIDMIFYSDYYLYEEFPTLYAFSLNAPFPPPDLLPWPMARHDVKGTSLYTGDPYPPW